MRGDDDDDNGPAPCTGDDDGISPNTRKALALRISNGDTPSTRSALDGSTSKSTRTLNVPVFDPVGRFARGTFEGMHALIKPSEWHEG